MLDDKSFRPAFRSLLQKAVRRGDLKLVLKVMYCLQKAGDLQWLAKRSAVITFEECWPLGAMLSKEISYEKTMKILLSVTRLSKMKDAAGLGTLALAYTKGDRTVFTGVSDDRHIYVISEAIKRPSDFWNWACNNSSNEYQEALVDSAFFFYKKGGWPWDKAFMQAAAYLALVRGIDRPTLADRKELACPVWVALDKHTPQGKKALAEVAQKTQISRYKLSWISFYFESTLTNNLEESTWWKREIEWKLRRLGLSYIDSKNIWRRTRPLLIENLGPSVKAINEYITLFDAERSEEVSACNKAFGDIDSAFNYTSYHWEKTCTLKSDQLSIFQWD